MLDLSQAIISRLAIHRVGNKSQEENPIISDKLADVSPELESVLLTFFLRSFKETAFYKFVHPQTLAHNQVFSFTEKIFEDESTLYTRAINILQHLHHQSVHPNIKSGELYVALMRNCILDDEPLDALGIFKCENKDTFLNVRHEPDGLEAAALMGTRLNKLDKGCIIFNTEAENGYRILTIDASGKDSVYWMDDFLQVAEDSDCNLYTRDALNLCNAFANDMLTPQHGKKDEVLFMINTLDYFSKEHFFEFEEFAEEVINDEEYTKTFKDFLESYETRIGRKVENDFVISKPAFDLFKKKFKPVIKLDTGMELHLKFKNTASGSRFIDRGYDEEIKMSYYKVFYNEET